MFYSTFFRYIGPSPAIQSYLNTSAILSAAIRAGAKSIHPGYGFLSESPDFAEACTKSGLIFVGPPAQAMRAVSSKSAAKDLMKRAGIPVVPGYHGIGQSTSDLAREAAKIGYPLLLKPTNSGGGKGMRIVNSQQQLQQATNEAKRESLSGFGSKSNYKDQVLLLERHITKARHVEVQVFADGHGSVVHLGERDCSVQRKFQKIIEETPAPSLSPCTRERMIEAAIRATKAVGYVGAGTVEFLLDEDSSGEGFFFIEMNTRLQVEHPITELTHSLDLVDWQLAVAAGLPLPLSQGQISSNGHAIEARLYAEDPNNEFIPNAGTIRVLKLPREVPRTIRVDTGVTQGDVISVHYDPMIAKIAVCAKTRHLAVRTLQDALKSVVVGGVRTNIGLLRSIAAHPEFLRGAVNTSFIADNKEHLLVIPTKKEKYQALAIATIHALLSDVKDLSGSPWDTLHYLRFGHNFYTRFQWKCDEGYENVDVMVSPSPPHFSASKLVHCFSLTMPDCSSISANCTTVNGSISSVQLDGYEIPWTSYIVSESDCGEVFVSLPAGNTFKFQEAASIKQPVEQEQTSGQTVPMKADATKKKTGGICSPLPGKLVQILVKVGDTVQIGKTVAIIEAMKMEHSVRASQAGTVQQVHCSIGDIVTDSQPLFMLANSK